jgi:hypothetical protein
MICGIGLRSVVKVINLINQEFHLGLEESPSYNSINNWKQKSGYFIYNNPEIASKELDYGLIIDESIQIGREKALFTLGVSANKVSGQALSMNDIEILDMSVSPSWNGELISKNLNATTDRLHARAAYVVSDNACIMNKGVRDSGLVHLHDVGHTLAMFLERQYKHSEDFVSFTKALARVRGKEIMRPAAYLLPPKQRSIARFMNLTPCLRWAKKILNCYDRLTREEQQTFKFLKKHKPLINELNQIIRVFNRISEKLKKDGLSRKNADESIKELQPLLTSPFPRVAKAAKECLAYLGQEVGKLNNEDDVWHISSDILESVFGIYKQGKSPDKLTGVTINVLTLPLLTKSDPETGRIKIDFKQALESVFLRDIHKWKEDKLSDNLTVKRMNVLNAS